MKGEEITALIAGRNDVAVVAVIACAINVIIPRVAVVLTFNQTIFRIPMPRGAFNIGNGAFQLGHHSAQPRIVARRLPALPSSQSE